MERCLCKNFFLNYGTQIIMYFIIVMVFFFLFQSPKIDVGLMRCSPLVSPSKSDRFYSDRFIPARAGNNWQTDFNMVDNLTTLTYFLFVGDIGWLTSSLSVILAAESDVEKFRINRGTWRPSRFGSSPRYTSDSFTNLICRY